MRTIKIINEKIHKLVTEYKEKALVVNNLTDDIEKIEKERNKVGLQIQKIKDKLNPIVEKETKDHVSEFEMVTNIQIGKETNEVEIDIFDQVEEFKDALRKKKTA